MRTSRVLVRGRHGPRERDSAIPKNLPLAGDPRLSPGSHHLTCEDQSSETRGGLIFRPVKPDKTPAESDAGGAHEVSPVPRAGCSFQDARNLHRPPLDCYRRIAAIVRPRVGEGDLGVRIVIRTRKRARAGTSQGRPITQDTPCRHWDYAGAFEIKSRPPESSRLFAPSAPGYLTEDFRVVPASSGVHLVPFPVRE